ncbi:MAG: phosphotransferase family protein [Candidatus Acidiferrales bacterium]
MPYLRDRPAAVRPGEELDLSRLESFLRDHFPESAGPLSIEQFPSGHSNLTYLLHLGPREIVLRRPPFGSKVKSAHDMGREYRVLSKLHRAFPAAPEALLYCEDTAVIGAPFYLMEPIRGLVLRRDPPEGVPFPAATARRLSESFVEKLAELHRLAPAAIGLADLGRPEGYLKRQVHGWIERYNASKTADLPGFERIAQWLNEHMPSANDATLIHNDYKYDNLVLDSADITRIIGVLDWEMCTIGDPLTDLGTALAYWVDPEDPEDLQRIRWAPTTYPGSMTRGQLVQYYSQITGRDVSHMVFYLALARFKVAVIVQQIYYRYHQGLTHDARFAPLLDVAKILLRATLHTIDAAST